MTVHFCDHGEGHGIHFCQCDWAADHSHDLGFYVCNQQMVSDA